jgi:hypothetical protein
LNDSLLLKWIVVNDCNGFVNVLCGVDNEYFIPDRDNETFGVDRLDAFCLLDVFINVFDIVD